jgi:DNA replication protein DnaD
LGELEYSYHFAQEEAEVCVADGAATTEEQSAVTVRKEEELEQTLEAAQAEAEEENEHSEEWLNDFSQGAEKKEAVALKLAAKEAKEQAGRFITPWEMELEMLEDWLNNPEPARELTEVELSEKVTEQKSVKGRLQS